LLLEGRGAAEASAFSAHIVPVIVQLVLEHVDRSRCTSGVVAVELRYVN